MKTCLNCNSFLSGKQKKYCSRKCKSSSDNTKYQNYQNQQKRGLDRKIQLIISKGGKCEICGYCKNYAALVFHHINSNSKDFTLDVRECSNRKWEILEKESQKCQLLCANCHAEIHYPHLLNN